MSSFGSSLAPPSSGLTASSINTLIQATLATQREPIKTLTSKKDTLTIEKAIYNDLKGKLTTLKGVVENLISTGSDTTFDDVSVTSTKDSDGDDVVTATATSAATNGKYIVDETTLATAHQVRSDQVTSITDDLDLEGAFTLNGASITIVATDSLVEVMTKINAADYGEPESKSVASTYATELDIGTVSDELRADFLLEGITLSSDATVSTVTEDTRWLITDHQKTYSIRAGESQLDIYRGGRGVNATIVDNQLVLETENTGAGNVILANGTILQGSGAAGTGLGLLTAPDTFKHTALESAGDATFDVNGITVTRALNTGLDDVIRGVTLNLLSDEGTEINVTSDHVAINAKIAAFVYNINDIAPYLKAKTGTTVDTDNETYTRGALAGKSIFSTLRMNLVTTLNTEATVGSLKRLSDIGITVGDGLKVSLDSTKLNSMLESNLEDVVQLFDDIMDKYLTILEPFTAYS